MGEKASVGELAALAVINAFWIRADLYLLFNQTLGESQANLVGVTPPVLEFGVFVVGMILTWFAHRSYEEGTG